MDRVVSWLTAGLTLSPKLQSALLRNIEQRTRYGAVSTCGPISLTRNQLSYAAKTNPEWFGLGLLNDDLEGDDDAIFPAPFAEHFLDFCAQFQQDFSRFSETFPHECLALANELTTIAAESCEKREAASVDGNSRVKERGEEISGEAMASALAPATEFSPPMSHEVAASAPLADVDLHDAKTSATNTFPPSITVWVKENSAGKMAATGFVEAGGDRFALVFAPYEIALQSMAQISSREWVQRLDAEYNQALRAREQASSGVASRATMSALYAKQDTHAFKKPKVPDHALVMGWENNVPAFSLLIDSQLQWHRFDFKKEGKDRFKGTLALN